MIDGTTVFVSGITAILGGGGVSWYVAYRKAPSEIRLAEAQVRSEDVETLRVIIGELRIEVARLAKENRELRENIATLERRIEDLSHHESRTQRRAREDNE